MENKFFSGIFKEKRFVFENPAPSAQPGEGGAVSSDKGVDTKQVEADKEVKKDNITAKTSEYLKDLKDSIGKDFEGLVNLVNFEGEVFEGEVSGGDFMKQKEVVSKAVLEKLKVKMEEQGLLKEDLDNLINFVWGLHGAAPLDVDSLKFIADVYTTSMLQSVEDGFKEMYPLFDEKLTGGDKYKIGYKINVANGGVSFLTEFKGGEAFEADYKKLEEEAGISRDVSSKSGEKKEGEKPEEDKKSEEKSAQMLADKKADEEKKKVDEELISKEAKIKALKGSFLGGALAFLGIVKNDEWGDVIDGNNWLAGLLVGMFGGGSLLANDPVPGAIENLDDKNKLLAQRAMEKAQGSLFSLSKIKVGTISAEEAKKLRDARSTYDGDKFKALIAGKMDRDRKIPDEGVRLGVDFAVKDGDNSGTLLIDLKNGGEMIIPPKSTLVVNGETEIAGDKEKPYKGSEIKITGTIPKGTLFKGKVGFEFVTETT
ncbi:hypothetical protein A3B60_04045 [Candidatus Peregrinibacteria bacterium RIFCSPLOWO2_01_FULL_39_12]|nr:MAG: hypothetical protein A3I58_01830 [Candidatus Peregrinibacteria bacterium RIFCSPLOWO2_02_FULL_39_10]OGJ42944.1 MAG: hypothetical protein A3B60_04045 [Candidatus Peregrinibacteria bacterium RIFCSPLOWO2_01_FULL_39_12]